MIYESSDIMTRNIMIKDFMLINIIDSVKVIKNIALEKGITHFLVMENSSIVGVITNKELIKAYKEEPIDDVMIDKFLFVSSETPSVRIKKIFEKENIEVILVENNHKIEGIITKDISKDK